MGLLLALKAIGRLNRAVDAYGLVVSRKKQLEQRWARSEQDERGYAAAIELLAVATLWTTAIRSRMERWGDPSPKRSATFIARVERELEVAGQLGLDLSRFLERCNQALAPETRVKAAVGAHRALVRWYDRHEAVLRLDLGNTRPEIHATITTEDGTRMQFNDWIGQGGCPT